MSVVAYRRKRDFDRTPEPRGNRRVRSGSRLFVIQKHAAKQLHYDFRIELDGVLKSWAVPKGPSLDPADKRLAVRVEDHPVDYGSFEGVIPAEQYGAGAVLIWDSGSWKPNGSAREGLRNGHLSFGLEGEKLHGGWELVRMAAKGRDQKENWLLIKRDDEHARRGKKGIVTTDARSVVSGRTIEEIAGGTDEIDASNEIDGSNKIAGANEVADAVGEIVDKARTKKRTPRNARRTKPSPRTGSSESLEIDGIVLTHPDRILFPEQGVRKRDLAAYYVGVSKWILPHIAGRPLSLLRCPDGQAEKCFFQRHVTGSTPAAIHVARITEATGRVAPYPVVEDRAGLISLVQMNVLEIHPWNCRAGDVEHPDRLVFDLDPDDSIPFARVVEVAFRVKELLEAAKLRAWAKVTGGKGVHVVVPIEPRETWESVHDFCRHLAEACADSDPHLITTNSRKSARPGKIYLDYLRNSRSATAIAPYSTRARSGAPVAVPVAWPELRQLRGGDFDIEAVIQRLEGPEEDPWKDLERTPQSIPRMKSSARSQGNKDHVKVPRKGDSATKTTRALLRKRTSRKVLG